VGLKPKAAFLPLFNLDEPVKAGEVVLATSLTAGALDSTPPPDTLLLLPSGIRVSGVESWVRKLAEVYRGPGRVILVHESVDIRSITPAFFLPIHGV